MRSLACTIVFLLSFSLLAEDYKLSDHFDGKKFFNPGKSEMNSFWDVVKWKMTADRVPWPDFVPIKNYPIRPLTSQDKGIVTFINHSTLLIQVPGLNILTDPVYSERTSPFRFLGPKRVKEPGLPFNGLPPIDIVLISHNHYDHLDLETLKQIDGKFHPLFLVPIGDEKLLLSSGIQNVKALDWWEEVRIKDTRIIFAPAQHWSARWLWDRNQSLWGSFMIDNGVKKIYFAGDTGYGPHFKEIKMRLGIPDLALLPIGAYLPQWFMRFHHMNPEDAVLAHIDLESKQSVGIHFGTFQLADEGIDSPILDLQSAKEKLQLSGDKFKVLQQGESLDFN